MNALYVNLIGPKSAVVYDRSYVRQLTSDLGLAFVDVEPPTVRGFQWTCVLAPRRAGIEEIDSPPMTRRSGAYGRQTYRPALTGSSCQDDRT